MNEPIFHAMQEQLSPSEEAKVSLKETLDQTPKSSRKPSTRKYIALAACAALMIAAIPAYRQLVPSDKLGTEPGTELITAPGLHSYIEVDSMTIDYTVGEVLPLFPSFELPEVATSTPEYVDQEKAHGLHATLMDYLGVEPGVYDAFPDWYGGAYLEDEVLVIALVKDKDTSTLRKELGGVLGSDGFELRSVDYAYDYLNQLMIDVLALPSVMNLLAACGVDEMNNYLGLTLTDVTDQVLSDLAHLDPADDAILVQVGTRPVHTETPVDPNASSNPDTDEAPAVDEGLDVFGGTSNYVDPDDVIAYEPIDPSDTATPDGQTPHNDLLITNDSVVSTPAYDPTAK